MEVRPPTDTPFVNVEVPEPVTASSLVAPRLVVVAVFAKRFVVDAVVAKSDVVVALVVVEFTTERLVIDDEALTMMPTVEVGVIALPPENVQLEPIRVDERVPPANDRPEPIVVD